MITKRRCCGAYINKKGPSLPDYIVQNVMLSQEATVVVQFKRAYSMQINNQVRHFNSTQQIRLPYSIVYGLLQVSNAPVFILNRVEEELFYKHYGIQES